MENSKKIVFKYKFSEEYNPVYINGAFGGLSPNGEIILNFYLERKPVPYADNSILDLKGNTLKSESFEPEDFDDIIIRFISNGIVMNLETAKSICVFIQDKIKEAEDRQKQIAQNK